MSLNIFLSFVLAIHSPGLTSSLTCRTREEEKEHVTHILSWSKWLDTVELRKFTEKEAGKKLSKCKFFLFWNLNTLQVIFMAFASSSINLLRNFQVSRCKTSTPCLHNSFHVISNNKILERETCPLVILSTALHTAPTWSSFNRFHDILLDTFVMLPPSTCWEGNEKSKCNNKIKFHSELFKQQTLLSVHVSNWW